PGLSPLHQRAAPAVRSGIADRAEQAPGGVVRPGPETECRLQCIALRIGEPCRLVFEAGRLSTLVVVGVEASHQVRLAAEVGIDMDEPVSHRAPRCSRCGLSCWPEIAAGARVPADCAPRSTARSYLTTRRPTARGAR